MFIYRYLWNATQALVFIWLKIYYWTDFAKCNVRTAKGIQKHPVHFIVASPTWHKNMIKRYYFICISWMLLLSSWPIIQTKNSKRKTNESILRFKRKLKKDNNFIHYTTTKKFNNNSLLLLPNRGRWVEENSYELFSQGTY